MNSYQKITVCFFAIMMNSILASNLYCQDKPYLNLPGEVKSLLKDSLNDYIIPNAELFDTEWKTYENITTPMLVCADFNGDTKQDYAIILFSKTRKTASLFTFVSKLSSYTVSKLGTYDLVNDLIDVFISIEKKGIWISPSGKKHIKNDGFTFIWASASITYSYFWDKSNFVKFLYD